jgi:AcrR family transcriptional regulator
MNARARRGYRMTARAARTVATGERILAAAMELFLALPYEQVSLDQVAKQAGVTVQTVLRRFGSKEGLVGAAAKAGIKMVRGERDLAPIGNVAGAVRNLIEHYETWGPRILRLLAQEEQVPPLRGVAEAGRRLHRRWVERTFAPLLPPSRAERTRRLTQLVAVTDLYVWKILRRDQRLSRRATETALVELVELLAAGA